MPPPFNIFGNAYPPPAEGPLDVTQTPTFTPGGTGGGLFARIVNSLGGPRGASRIRVPETLSHKPGFGDFLLGSLAGFYNVGTETENAEEEMRAKLQQEEFEKQRIGLAGREMDLRQTAQNFALTQDISKTLAKIPNPTPAMAAAISKGMRGEIPIDDPEFVRVMGLANAIIPEIAKGYYDLAIASGMSHEEAMKEATMKGGQAMARAEKSEDQLNTLRGLQIDDLEERLNKVIDPSEAISLIPEHMNMVTSLTAQLGRLAEASGDPGGVQNLVNSLLTNQGQLPASDLASLARLEAGTTPENKARMGTIRATLGLLGSEMVNLSNLRRIAGITPAQITLPPTSGAGVTPALPPQTFEGPPVDLSGPGLPGLLGQGASNLAGAIGNLPAPGTMPGGATLGEVLGMGKDFLGNVQKGLARKLGRDEDQIVSNAKEAVFWGIRPDGSVNQSLLTPLPRPGMPPPEPGPVGLNINEYAKLRQDVFAKGGTQEDVSFQLFLRLIQNEGFPELATELARVRAQEMKSGAKKKEAPDISPSAIVDAFRGKGKK